MARRIALLVTMILAVAGSAFADKPKILVLPLPASGVDRDAARAFDARLLVALEATGHVTTVTPSDEPECTTTACLAALGTTAGAPFVLAMSVVRERGGVTLFATLLDAKTATSSRRAELVRLSASSLASSAPAEVARQIAGTPVGPTVLGVSRSTNAGVSRAASDGVAAKLAALRTFAVETVDSGTDRATLTHRAELVINEFSITRGRHHVHDYLDGVLVGTLAITDLANRSVLFSQTVKVTVSRRARYSTPTEVTALLVEAAVTDWMSAFRNAGVEPRLRGVTR